MYDRCKYIYKLYLGDITEKTNKLKFIVRLNGITAKLQGWNNIFNKYFSFET